MPTKTETIFLCGDCGAEFLKWAGKCEVCGAWNTLKPFSPPKAPKVGSPRTRGAFGFPGAGSKSGSSAVPQASVAFKSINSSAQNRLTTGISELDRVLGGGVVPGSVVLLGGEPGIGKSTLVLQLAGAIKTHNQQKVLYLSGEESAEQIKMRADRLKTPMSNLSFLAENDLEIALSTIHQEKPTLAIIDSIQTLASDGIASSAGSVAQVKNAAIALTELAKSTGIPILLIGHVNKAGSVAGPRVLEHLVDCVLYLEGDRFHSFRILRAVKNRFGSTNETGIFTMEKQGLVEVKNPSKLFLEERAVQTPGSVVTAVVEGTRAFLIEVQALTTTTNFGYPKRTASGFDLNRLQLLIAVLQKRARLRLDQSDVYVNIVGGFKIQEPAADLAVALAVASAFKNKAFDPKAVVLGELGLGGEIRSVSQLEKRISQAKKLGFESIFIPAYHREKGPNIHPVRNIAQAIEKTL